MIELIWSSYDFIKTKNVEISRHICMHIGKYFWEYLVRNFGTRYFLLRYFPPSDKIYCWLFKKGGKTAKILKKDVSEMAISEFMKENDS